MKTKTKTEGKTSTLCEGVTETQEERTLEILESNIKDCERDRKLILDRLKPLQDELSKLNRGLSALYRKKRKLEEEQ